MQNPFKPTAGATPPDLIGRAGLLDEFEYGLLQGSGAPGLLAVSDLLNEGVATFLRRADRINLHEAAIAEVTTDSI